MLPNIRRIRSSRSSRSSGTSSNSTQMKLASASTMEASTTKTMSSTGGGAMTLFQTVCLLIIATLVALDGASAFHPTSTSSASFMQQRQRTTSAAAATLTETKLSEANTAPAAAVKSGGDSNSDKKSNPAASAASQPTIQQSDYGTTLELPGTYVTCGQCGSSYAFTPELLGNGPGRRMECGVCGHTWFQSPGRIAKINPNNFEMVPMPETDLDRIKSNIAEGKHPKHLGDYKMYVGNISFQTDESDLRELFEGYGPVGDVSIVRDNDGRPRGFAFVTMRNTSDGERCLSELDGTDLQGRNLSVRPPNN